MEYKQSGPFTCKEIKMLKPIVEKQTPVKVIRCHNFVVLQITKKDLHSIKLSLRHYCNEEFTLALLRRIELGE